MYGNLNYKSPFVMYSMIVKARLASILDFWNTRVVFLKSYMVCGGLLRIDYPMGRDISPPCVKCLIHGMEAFV